MENEIRKVEVVMQNPEDAEEGTDGLNQIEDVILYDENGDEIEHRQDLAFTQYFHEPSSNEESPAEYVARELGVDVGIVELVW